MIRKALVRTVIYEFLEEKNLFTQQEVIDNAQQIYDYLKTHKYGDLTEGLPFTTFKQYMLAGVQIAQMKASFQGSFFR